MNFDQVKMGSMKYFIIGKLKISILRRHIYDWFCMLMVILTQQTIALAPQQVFRFPNGHIIGYSFPWITSELRILVYNYNGIEIIKSGNPWMHYSSIFESYGERTLPVRGVEIDGPPVLILPPSDYLHYNRENIVKFPLKRSINCRPPLLSEYKLLLCHDTNAISLFHIAGYQYS